VVTLLGDGVGGRMATASHYSMVGSGRGWTETILLLEESANKFRILRK
jgi:hypothetical protein